MKYSAIAISGLILVGCSTANDEAIKHLPINIIDSDDAEQCQFLGEVSGTEEMSYTEERDLNLAYKNASQAAIELGANSAVIKEKRIPKSGNTAAVIMDAYRCE